LSVFFLQHSTEAGVCKVQLSQRKLHYAEYLLLPWHCTIKNNHKIKERNVMPCTLSAALADAAVCRGSFHAVLRTDVPDAVFAAFSAALQKAQAEGRILTASLFRCEAHLFFYAEGLNRPFTPQGLCPALDAALLPWPPALGETAPRPWAAM
jgi:hypothetical protein